MKPKDLHFWETYLISLVSIFTGCVMGFSLNGNDTTQFFPFLFLIWFGVFCFILYFRRGEKINC